LRELHRGANGLLLLLLDWRLLLLHEWRGLLDLRRERWHLHLGGGEMMHRLRRLRLRELGQGIERVERHRDGHRGCVEIHGFVG
jgi:hypothetical protein